MKIRHIFSLKRTIIFLIFSIVIIYLVETLKIIPVVCEYTKIDKLKNNNEFTVKFPRALSVQLFLKGHNIRFIETVNLEIESSNGRMILNSNSFEFRNDKIYLYPQIVSDNNYTRNNFRNATLPVSLFVDNEAYKMKLSYVSKNQIPVIASLHMTVFIQGQYSNRRFNPFDTGRKYIENNEKSKIKQFWELHIQ